MTLHRSSKLSRKLPQGRRDGSSVSRLSTLPWATSREARQKFDLALQEFQRGSGYQSARRRRHDRYGRGVTRIWARFRTPRATYKRAIALRPDYWDGYRALAEFYDRQKRVQDSIAQYRRIIELTPDNPEAYSDLGVQYLELKDSQSLSAAKLRFRNPFSSRPTIRPTLTSVGCISNRNATRKPPQRRVRLSNSTTRIGAFGPTSRLAYAWLKDDEKMRFAPRKDADIFSSNTSQ